MMSEDTSNVIGSQELVVGCLPLNGQDGADPSGLEAVPVSRFRARDSEKAMPTNATSGPLFSSLSPSASLQFALESRLRQRMVGNGCPLYDLTWSQWDMPAGPQICRHRARARRTSANGSTGWLTPKALNGRRGLPKDPEATLRALGKGQQVDLSDLALLAGWPSPLANKQSPQQRGDFTPNLANVAQTDGLGNTEVNAIAGHCDGQSGNGSQTSGQQEPSGGIRQFLSGWATPTSRDHKDGAANLE